MAEYDDLTDDRYLNCERMRRARMKKGIQIAVACLADQVYARCPYMHLK